jgi:hypothetical protein
MIGTALPFKPSSNAAIKIQCDMDTERLLSLLYARSPALLRRRSAQDLFMSDDRANSACFR